MKKETVTDCELLVMKVIWESKEKLALPGIVERVNKKYSREWKPQTVSTFLARLVRKEFLQMTRSGRLFLYTPLVAQEDYRGEVIEECVDFWSNSDAGSFLCALHEKRKLRPDEVETIKGLLDDLD